jgi:hypothetical protein
LFVHRIVLWFLLVEYDSHPIVFLHLFNHRFQLYGIHFNLNNSIVFLKDFFIGLTIMFPFLFLLGWLPSIQTFFMVFLEGIHIQFFGGTGFINLIGGFLQIFLDFAVLGVLIGSSIYSSLQNSFGRDYYSGIYSGLLVSLSYFLSRSPSNYLYYVVAVKDIFKSIYYLCSRKKRIENETESKFYTN